MRILLVDRGFPGGIYQASCYLRDYLSQHHEVKMISLNNDDYKKIIKEYNDQDVIIIHDIVIDMSLLRDLKCPKIYFVPGVFPYQDMSHLDTYDYILSPAKNFLLEETSLKTIKWCFNIFCPENVTHINERKSDALYIGRVDSLKMSIHFLAQFLKSGHKITIAGKIRRENEEEELLAKLLEHENVNYLGVVPHDEAIDLMTQHKFSILASQTDIFSLYMLEAIYNGCIPIIERRTLVEYPWVVDSTYKVWNALDIVNVYETLKSFPDNLLQQYRDFHRQQVLDKMNKISDINIFNEIIKQ